MIIAVQCLIKTKKRMASIHLNKYLFSKYQAIEFCQVGGQVAARGADNTRPKRFNTAKFYPQIPFCIKKSKLYTACLNQ